VRIAFDFDLRDLIPCGMNNFKVSIFQATAREEKPEYRLNWLDMAAERASGEGSQLLVCPELYLSGYHVAEKLEKRAVTILGEYSERVGEIAQLHDIAIVYGYPEREGNKLYNTAAFMTPEAKMLAHHRKNHIPPGFEKDMFTPGKQLRVFEYSGWKMAILICYDIEFPEAARQATLAGAELLIVPTALGDQWHFVADKMVPTRAWENGVYLAYANWAGQEGGKVYLGGSRIIGPDGETDAIGGSAEVILSATLEKSRLTAARARLPYLEDRRQYGL
jgi:predicted amidohydrolase